MRYEGIFSLDLVVVGCLLDFKLLFHIHDCVLQLGRLRFESVNLLPGFVILASQFVNLLLEPTLLFPHLHLLLTDLLVAELFDVLVFLDGLLLLAYLLLLTLYLLAKVLVFVSKPLDLHRCLQRGRLL
jgi:hypothetical protein